LTEWGDYTQRYYDIRELLSKVTKEPLPVVPPRPEFQYIGKIALNQSASLFDCDQIATITDSVTAEPMEYYGQDYGYIRYSKIMFYDAPYDNLALYGVADRAHLYLNGELLGIRMRKQNEEEPFRINGLKKGDRIDVLVENMGRVNFGSIVFRGDRKGILDGIYGQERLMTNFKVYSYAMKSLDGIKFEKGTEAKLPAFFKGKFVAQNNNDCFIRFDNFPWFVSCYVVITFNPYFA
jgi:beta-galactosidase